MRKLLNTLYITTEDAYLALDGENVTVSHEDRIIGRFPLHTLETIITFSFAGASPALMGYCASNAINLTFCSPRGRFLARVSGENNGNVLLRRTQYRVADDQDKSLSIASAFIFGKLYNSRQTIQRTRRDHGLIVNDSILSGASETLKSMYKKVFDISDIDELRGFEGIAAKIYFNVFDEMILSNKQDFRFEERNRRPPLDPVNALLSFAYSLLANDCASALESVGLDAYVGFMHADRPGRASLALDLMEELRSPIADRFVLTLINNRSVTAKDFTYQESGAVLLTDDFRKKILKAWQERKKEQITHPFLKEKIEWGLVPYVQSLLLARYLRGDLDTYPPFLWK